jgi:hypothetical protein
MSVVMRREVEEKIVGAFVDSCLKAGYRLAVSLERGYDTNEMLLGSTDRAKIMEEAFAGDECHIFVQPPTGPTITKDGSVVSRGWVYCVFGNDGWDVICDYTTNLDKLKLLDEANKLSDHYGG